MNLKGIPIVTIGPGSQPAEEDGAQLDYISMPKEMATYQAPPTPEPEDVESLTGAREAMRWLKSALADYRPGGTPLIADITALDEANRELVNQILGEGEVSVTYENDFRARVQESVLAGIWRTFCLDGEDRVTHDLLEVGPSPYVASLHSSRPAQAITDWLPAEAPDGLMNAMAIATELEEHRVAHTNDETPYAVNLTLLPLSPEDITFLNEILGRGPVDILSRGYGNCQITSTAIPRVWWVRYHNSMGLPIVNSIEIIDVPPVACAAAEDIADSGKRLEEILEPYWRELS
jgi:hydrogenase-1 operon protein HyaF